LIFRPPARVLASMSMSPRWPVQICGRRTNAQALGGWRLSVQAGGGNRDKRQRIDNLIDNPDRDRSSAGTARTWVSGQRCRAVLFRALARDLLLGSPRCAPARALRTAQQTTRIDNLIDNPHRNRSRRRIAQA
jgi:hypothetical protein